ncbi:MAG: glycosyl hydrolase, partial [Chitinivibrionales bacterium]|nr:glycosyl hydrolase [Chitinivibrionales bacterium]
MVYVCCSAPVHAMRRPTTMQTRYHGKLREVSLSSIEPEGWLRLYLEKQARGLTGHPEVAGYPFDAVPFAVNERTKHRHGTGWWPYEQAGYWLDGATRCAHLVQDAPLLAKVGKQIDFLLKHADRDGFIGPSFLKEEGHCNQWAHAVFLRALMARHSATGDKRIVDALRRHYRGNACDFGHYRETCNVEQLGWAYARTGDPALLRAAKTAYRRHQVWARKNDPQFLLETMLTNARATTHGVSFCEIMKLGAVMYLYTGTRRWLDASVKAFRKLERHQMLIDGVPSSSEFLRGKDPLDSHETCVVSDYTWAAGYLLMATGDATWADRIERAVLNAGMGAITKDFSGLQYFSCPNQVVATANSNHNIYFGGGGWMRYAPNPGTECCAGNVHRILPNYAARMWMTGRDGDPVACLYGASRHTFTPKGTKRSVTIVEETNYPFSEEITFQVRTAAPVAFGLTVRIPGWCRGATVYVNGVRRTLRTTPGTFVTIRRTFANNDRITVRLPMRVKQTRWPKGGTGIEYG